MCCKWHVEFLVGTTGISGLGTFGFFVESMYMVKDNKTELFVIILQDFVFIYLVFFFVNNVYVCNSGQRSHEKYSWMSGLFYRFYYKMK